MLALESLTEWVAKRVDLKYRHIDPLKIDFSAVTEVMSSDYATRFRILPISVNSKEAVIAVSEPYVREWKKELQRSLKLELRRVIANPQDIEKYQVEFYNLAKSMKGAAHGEILVDARSIELLGEASKAHRLMPGEALQLKGFQQPVQSYTLAAAL